MLPKNQTRIIIMELTIAFCYDQDPITTINKNKLKYDPLLETLIDYRWTSPLLLVVTLGYIGDVSSIHIVIIH